MIHSNKPVRETPQVYGQRMIFTGPDGIGDYQPRSNYFPWHIGEGAVSPEGTSDLKYLFRAAPHTPHPGPTQSYVGGIGWGLSCNQLLNHGTLLSDMQIKKSDCRAVLEERVTQRFQDPWHKPPHIVDKQPTGARGRLAWTHHGQRPTLPPIKERRTSRVSSQQGTNNFLRDSQSEPRK